MIGKNISKAISSINDSTEPYPTELYRYINLNESDWPGGYKLVFPIATRNGFKDAVYKHDSIFYSEAEKQRVLVYRLDGRSLKGMENVYVFDNRGDT